jgi:hypothetical protein
MIIIDANTSIRFVCRSPIIGEMSTGHGRSAYSSIHGTVEYITLIDTALVIHYCETYHPWTYA